MLSRDLSPWWLAEEVPVSLMTDCWHIHVDIYPSFILQVSWWVEIYYIGQHVTAAFHHHYRLVLLTHALCSHGFVLFMPNTQTANSMPNRNQDSSDRPACVHSSLIQLWPPYAHISFTFLLFAKLNRTWCSVVLITHVLSSCFLRSPAAGVLRCHLTTCSLPVSLSDSHLWPLFDEVFLPSGLQLNLFYILS